MSGTLCQEHCSELIVEGEMLCMQCIMGIKTDALKNMATCVE